MIHFLKVSYRGFSLFLLAYTLMGFLEMMISRTVQQLN